MSAFNALRRLRFEISRRPDESIPGVIARAIRQHVLYRTGIVLDEAGAELRHVGFSQLADAETLDRIAYVLRCPPEQLVEVAGSRVNDGQGKRTTRVNFGSIEMAMLYLELKRRRVGPLSLEIADHHRLAWLNTLLPYCPESLERLVSECSHCGAILTWYYSEGIGTCEYCSTRIAASAEPSLPQSDAEPYRLFAKLAGPDTSGLENAYDSLPSELREESPATLVRLALHLGGIMQATPVIGASKNTIFDLRKPDLAKLIVDGTAQLLTWPHGLRSWFDLEMEKAVNPTQLAAIRGRLTRVADRRQENDHLHRLVTSVFPNIARHPVHGFIEGERYYTTVETQRLLGLDAAQISQLRTCSAVNYQHVTGVAKKTGRFDADQIDELTPQFRSLTKISSLTAQWLLPRYAGQALAMAGLLDRSLHPAVEAVCDGWMMSKARADAFIAALVAKASTQPRPNNTVTLYVGAKLTGGRLKPWARVYAAMLSGELPFWLEGVLPTTYAIQVDKSAMKAVALEAELPLVNLNALHSDCSQRDVAEVWNVYPKEVQDIAREHNLRFERKGRAFVTSFEAMIKIAREVAWSVEITSHLGCSGHRLPKLLEELKVRSIGSGWSREDLIAQNVIPALPSGSLET